MAPPNPSATKIMIIRHAEKPSGKGAPYGVNSDGVGDPESLTVQGWQRAGALADLFAPSRGSLQDPHLATPQFIFASKAAPHTGSDSMRPQETVTPLIDKLQKNGNGVTVNFEFLKGEEPAAADLALGCQGVVLICWEHKNILTIVNEILKNQPETPGIPRKWPGDHYDLVWIFDWNAGTGMYEFNQVPQILLAGDTAITAKLLKKEGL